MIATVRKWGNSLALRIPRTVARDTHLEDGTVVEVAVREGTLIIERARKPKRYTLEELVNGITKENIHPSVDTGPAVGREEW